MGGIDIEERQWEIPPGFVGNGIFVLGLWKTRGETAMTLGI